MHWIYIKTQKNVFRWKDPRDDRIILEITIILTSGLALPILFIMEPVAVTVMVSCMNYSVARVKYLTNSSC